MHRRSVIALTFFALVGLVPSHPTSGFAAPPTPPSSQWISIGPDGGRVQDFRQSVSSPDFLYALPYRMGVYRSTDRGTTWSRRDQDLPLDTIYTRLAVSPIDPDVVLLTSWNTGTVLRSTDGAATWSSHAVGPDFSSVADFRFDPHDTGAALLAVTGGAAPGLYRTTDGGLTWASSNSGLASTSVNSLAFHPTTPGVVLLGGADGVSRSTDGGVTWTASDTQGFLNVRSTSFCAIQPDRVWGSAWDIGLISDDGGQTFATQSLIDCFPFGCNYPRILASPDNPQEALVASEIQVCSLGSGPLVSVFHLTANGTSWDHNYSHIDHCTHRNEIRGLEADRTLPGTAYLVSGNVGGDIAANGLVRTTDEGASWSPMMDGIAGTRILRIASDDVGTIHAWSPFHASIYSRDGLAQPWVTAAPITEGLTNQREVAMAAPPGLPGRVLVGLGYPEGDAYGIGLVQSHDGGQSWTGVSLDTPDELFLICTWVGCSSDGQMLYMSSVGSSTSPGYLFRGPDGVRTLLEPVPLAFEIEDAEVDPTDGNRIFAAEYGGSGGVRLTTDAGDTWEIRSTGLPADIVVELLMNRTTPDHLLLVYEDAGVWETTDGALTWLPVSLPGAPGGIKAADWSPATGEVFLASEGGTVYVSGRGTLAAELPTRALESLHFLPGNRTLLVGSDHGGVHSIQLPRELPVNAPEPVGRERVQLRAIPNPFAGGTRLEYQVPTAGERVEVAVFSVKGQRVRTLFRGGAGSGSGVAYWDGRAADGAHVAAGVYFAQIRQGDAAATVRIVRLDGGGGR